MPRYPEIRVKLRTANPYCMVAAIREEMRRAGVARDEIERFSTEALAAGEPGQMRRVCQEWAQAEPSR